MQGYFMKKSALMIPVAASAAALLIIAAAARSNEAVRQPDPYSAISWLTAVMAFAVFAIMLSEYLVHGRTLNLYLAGTFLALGFMGVWDALTFSYGAVFPSFYEVSRWPYLLLWEAQWITLAGMLIYGIFVSGKLHSRELIAGRTFAVMSFSILFAAIMIFLATTWMFQWASDSDLSPKIWLVVSALCAAGFAAACVIYSRAALVKANGVFAWLAYGLIFAFFAQAAIVLKPQPTETVFWFASLMKILVFLSPLAGMLAEHTRLQVQIRDQASELRKLIQTQHAVVSSVDLSEQYRRIVELATNSLSATAACLLTFEKERGLLKVGAQVGFDDETAKRLVFRPGESPLGDAFSTGGIVFTRNAFDDPILAGKLEGVKDIRSAVFNPLVVRNDCLGVLALFFSGRPMQKLSKEHQRLLDLLSSQAALAVEGFQLRDRMTDSAKVSDDYAQELEIVWEIGRAVASELDLHALVDALADKLKDAVDATTCSALIVDADQIRLRILGNKQLTRQHTVGEHVDQCDSVALAVAQQNEVLIANDVPNSAHCKYPELANEDGGTHHLMCVPMSLRGFIGAISVFRQNTSPFGEKEKRLLTRLAPVVATGIRNAQLYEREKAIADSLQKTMLPDLDHEYEGLRVSHRCQAALDESLVGGDFYDVIDFGDGKYGIAIGDVAGKGIEAAVYTAMARYMIQSYSADDPDPVYVVPRLNTALCRYTPVGKFVTLVYGLLDTGKRTFTYVNAGHELPFLHRGADNRLETLVSTGPAAGALVDGEYHSETVAFSPGDTLIFYTDGATEARCEGKFLGTEGLQKIVSELVHKHADDLPDAMLAGIQTYAKGHLHDDIAILAIKARVPGQLF